MIWQLCALFTRWLLKWLGVEITWTCKYCGGVLPLDDAFIDAHLKRHREDGDEFSG